MRIVIIPARGGSQRIKRKNIVDFHGKPMIAYPLQAAKDSGLFDVIHVTTEDSEIAETVKRLGYEVPFLRPVELAGDHTPVLDAFDHVIKKYADQGQHFTTICLLMPTSPLILASDLQRGVEMFEQTQDQAPVLSVATYPCPTEWALKETQVGVVESEFPDKMSLRSQDLPKKYYDTGNFCIFSPKDLADRARGTFTRFLKCEIERHRAVDIDEPGDLEFAKKLFLAQV